MFETAEGKQELQFIVFALDEREFGINVMDSREIITAEDLTVIPDSPPFVRGVINLRDKIIPVVDLKVKFDLGSNTGEKTKVVIVSAADTLVGLCVSEVEEIVRINSENISEPPQITQKIDREYIQGIARLDGRLLVMLDIDNLLTRRELKELQEVDTD